MMYCMESIADLCLLWILGCVHTNDFPIRVGDPDARRAYASNQRAVSFAGTTLVCDLPTATTVNTP